MRTVASQMPDARGTTTTVLVEAGDALLRASGRVFEFAGFRRAYLASIEEEANELNAASLPWPPATPSAVPRPNRSSAPPSRRTASPKAPSSRNWNASASAAPPPGPPSSNSSSTGLRLQEGHRAGPHFHCHGRRRPARKPLPTSSTTNTPPRSRTTSTPSPAARKPASTYLKASTSATECPA
jgi:hypothetical protein